MATTPQDPALFVIFGGTGDLATRKLFPALAQSVAEGLLDERTQFVGVGRAAKTDEAFRADIRAGAGGGQVHARAVGEAARAAPLPADRGQQVEDFRALAKRLERPVRGAQDSGQLRVLPVAAAGSDAGDGDRLRRGRAPQARGRLDADRAREAVRQGPRVGERAQRTWSTSYFTEEQIYRIDHYLGKETVQNLLVFRLANGLIESAWNRERIDSVQITVGETLGVGSRAGYYDKSGALRDMVQNHLAQLLTLVAMEVPSSFDAELRSATRRSRCCARSRRSIPSGSCAASTRPAPCDGEQCKGYLEEANIPHDSQTETFVALELYIDTWRWKGVPFYLRTGKRLPRKDHADRGPLPRGAGQLFQEDRLQPRPRRTCSSSRSSRTRGSRSISTSRSRASRSGSSGSRCASTTRTTTRASRRATRRCCWTCSKATRRCSSTPTRWRSRGSSSCRSSSIRRRPRPYAAGTWGPPEADRLAIPEAVALWQKAMRCRSPALQVERRRRTRLTGCGECRRDCRAPAADQRVRTAQNCGAQLDRILSLEERCERDPSEQYRMRGRALVARLAGAIAAASMQGRAHRCALREGREALRGVPPTFDDILFDYSKHRVTARRCGCSSISRAQADIRRLDEEDVPGERINITEDRAGAARGAAQPQRTGRSWSTART